MKKYIIIIALGIATVSCNSCQELFDTKGYKYEVLKSEDSKELVFLHYGHHIVGIDTTTFTVKAHVRMDDMVFGGVAKLPTGGIAFTHHRRASNNAWGSTLYVTDAQYNVVNKYPICPSPMAPKVINNVLMVGSTAYEEGGTMKFQLYNTGDFSLIKEFLFEDMVDAWVIAEYEHYAYFGIPVDIPTSERQYSYVVQLDLNSGNITEYSLKNDFFKESTYSICRQDSILYVFNRTKKDICTINLNNQSISNVVPISKYPEIAATKAWSVVHPKAMHGHLYSFFSGFDGQQGFLCYWVKLNASTFALEDIKEIKMPIISGDTGAAEQFLIGRFLVSRIEKYVLFIDIESGEIVETVDLDID